MLTVLGVVALVWGAVIWRWGDPATGLYTRWEQRQLSGQLQSLETTYAPALRRPATSSKPYTAPAKPVNVKALARRLRMTTASGNALGRIRVSRLGLNMIVVDGTDHDALVRGPGIDRRTHLPGEGERRLRRWSPDDLRCTVRRYRSAATRRRDRDGHAIRARSPTG